MAENIYINQKKVRETAVSLETVTACLKEIPLQNQDIRTTLPANTNGQISYERAQKNLAELGVCLAKEAQNIRELGAAFTEFDEMARSLAMRR